MKPIALNLCFLTMLMPALRSFGQDKEDPRAKLVGVWVGHAVKGKGENPERMGVKVELIITKDTITGIGFKGGERVDLGSGTYQVRPGQLDGDKKLPNPNRKEIWLGVYELQGDSLRWCVGRKKRPMEFDGKDDAYLLILKRQPAK